MGLFREIFRRRIVRYNGSSPAALEQQYAHLNAEHNRRLEAEWQKRREQAQDTTKGTPVWFSHYVENGIFRHCVLGVGDIKYELRRDLTTETYTTTIAPCSLDRGVREAALVKSSRTRGRRVLHLHHQVDAKAAWWAEEYLQPGLGRSWELQHPVEQLPEVS